MRSCCEIKAPRQTATATLFRVKFCFILFFCFLLCFVSSITDEVHAFGLSAKVLVNGGITYSIYIEAVFSWGKKIFLVSHQMFRGCRKGFLDTNKKN
jgi:hypothetical protein